MSEDHRGRGQVIMAERLDLLSTARRCAESGLLSEAESHYRQFLDNCPADAEAWSDLGAVLYGLGRTDEAISSLEKAIQFNPNLPQAQSNLAAILLGTARLAAAVGHARVAVTLVPDSPDYLNNLGNALFQNGRLSEAIEIYRRAVQLRPDFAQAMCNLAAALRDFGRLDEAEFCFEQALRLEPHQPAAQFGLGLTYQRQQKLDLAIERYRRALALRPDFSIAICNLATALRDQGNWREAEQYFGHALHLKPDLPSCWFGLGLTYQRQRKLDAAIECYGRTIELCPDHGEAYAELGAVLFDQQRFDEAVENLLKATALRPDCARLQANHGLALHFQGNYGAALAAYEKALQDPTCRDLAHWNRSLTMLLHGRFDQGWQEYESRWIAGEDQEPDFERPRWSGESLADKTILLWAEQGFGDTIQFIRYAQLLCEKGAHVVVQSQAPLRNVLTRTPGIDRLIAAGEPLPPFDFHIPFMSVPRVLKTKLDSIPADVPYLFAADALVRFWKERLGEMMGSRLSDSSNPGSRVLVGINWAGRSGSGAQRQRDIPLSAFREIASIPGVKLISLQKGEALTELRSLTPALPIVDLGDEFDDLNGAFMDTAAIMKNLDLVITSDTAVAHLAGALGVRVWVALPHVPDWRWLLDRRDSPWYPTMKLFRQPAAGDWQSVFAQIREELTTLQPTP